MIIWGLWFDGAFWFGTGSKTQKARNLAKNPNCIVGTQNAAEAVILEGVAELMTDPAIGRKLEPTSLSKYGMSGGDGSGPLYRVRPSRVFGLYRKELPEDCDALDIRSRSVSVIDLLETVQGNGANKRQHRMLAPALLESRR
jgi:hypothetical protein